MAVNIQWNLLGRLPDFYGAFQEGRQDRARGRAGQALAAGDYDAAAGHFYDQGMVDEGARVQRTQEEREARRLAAEERRAAAQKTAEAEEAAQLERAMAPLARVPEADRPAAFERMTGAFKALRMTDEQINMLRQLPKDDQSLAAFGAKLEEKKNVVMAPGSQLRDPVTGDLIAEAPFAPTVTKRTNELGGEDIVVVDKTPTSGGFSGGDYNLDDVFGALVMQESGGRPGVVGPDTPYGNALGMTQMLPATAEEMARKIGVPFNQARLRGTSEKDAEYQRMLGRAYFEEGLEKYGGDVRKALLYYHGGPDEKLWGPKTQGYADAVLRRVQPRQVAGLAQAPEEGGVRTVVRGGAPAPIWEDLPDGSQRNRRTGERKAPPINDKAFDNERAIVKDFEGREDVAKYRAIAGAWQTIDTLTRKPNPSGQDDIALTYSFMKVWDPTSVVREGEYAMVAKGAGVPQEIVRAMQRVDEGQTLTPKMRADMRRAAASIVPGARERFDREAARYRDIAQRGGINPDLVAPAPGTWKAKAGQQPQARQPSQTPPREAIAYLRRNPGMKAAFDAKYGAGAAARYGVK